MNYDDNEVIPAWREVKCVMWKVKEPDDDVLGSQSLLFKSGMVWLITGMRMKRRK